MATRTAKGTRIALRVTGHQKETIEAAAAALGRSVTDFAVQVAVEKADEVLADRRTFHVPDHQWAEFERLLDAPVRPNGGLVDLFAKPSVFTAR
ncbi:type II toxin-antitoxin system TacA family antitoxin [Cellulomonas hominis]